MRLCNPDKRIMVDCQVCPLEHLPKLTNLDDANTHPGTIREQHAACWRFDKQLGLTEPKVSHEAVPFC